MSSSGDARVYGGGSPYLGGAARAHPTRLRPDAGVKELDDSSADAVRFPQWVREVRRLAVAAEEKLRLPGACLRRSGEISAARKRRVRAAPGRDVRRPVRGRAHARLRALRDRACAGLWYGLPPRHSTISKRWATTATSASSAVSTTASATASSSGCTASASAACVSACGSRHGPPDFNVIRRTADRVRGLGWHLRLHLGRDALSMYADELDTHPRHPGLDRSSRLCRSRAGTAAAGLPLDCRQAQARRGLVADALERQPAFADGGGLGRRHPDRARLHRGGARSPDLGHRLAACAVAQAAHDERRRGGRAALSLCR